jgi:hypothetical protein
VEVAGGGFHIALHIAEHARGGTPDYEGTDEGEYYKEAPEAHLACPLARHHHIGVAKYAARPEFRQLHACPPRSRLHE